MNVPHDINMNFVEYMNIKQSFTRLPDGTRILNEESLVTEFKVLDAVNGLYALNRNSPANPIFLKYFNTPP